MPDLIRVLVPAAVSFMIGMALTPVLTHYLYAYKAWKKTAGKRAMDGSAAEEFNKLHQVQETRAPRMGGVVIWAAAILTIAGVTASAHLFPDTQLLRLDFLSRNQTWIPLAVLIIGSLVGLLDDLLVIRPDGEGLKLRYRLLIVVVLSGSIGWWFWAKLGVVAVSIPFGSPVILGAFIIPFFIIMSLALYASGVIDGIDGLSAGVFASVFAAYTVIAYAQDQINLAAFSAAIVGGLLAFLWFNIPPARFYMSDTGTMGLTLVLATIAFMTDQIGGGAGIFVLPIIGMMLVVTVISVVAQIAWKRIFKRKLLRIAPLHHHFEAVGWPGYKVTMRYWVLSVVFAVLGTITALAAIGHTQLYPIHASAVYPVGYTWESL